MQDSQLSVEKDLKDMKNRDNFSTQIEDKESFYLKANFKTNNHQSLVSKNSESVTSIDVLSKNNQDFSSNLLSPKK